MTTSSEVKISPVLLGQELGHPDSKYLQKRVDECLQTLEALLKIHTTTKNCCPDITRRLGLTIGYVKDVRVGN